MPLSEPGLDIPLAYWLHLRQRVKPNVLHQLLADAKAGDVTLATLLVRAGQLTPDEVERALRSLTGAGSRWDLGTLVGDYVLGSKLGAGGMGQVFAARHRATGAAYAIKTLSGLADAEALARFERESRAQAAVDAHPNVVRVHTYGTHRGRPYLVMDLAAGGDLSSRLATGPMDPAAAAQLVAALARGLEHCHQRGVLHRDLKPANVLFGEEDRPQLVDFGLAALAGAQSLTETGTLLGTPAYMAPEQATGDTAQIGPTTDVYGLGALLYRCLAGHPPFQGQNMWKILHQVCHDRPAPLGAHVPSGLKQICERALAKDPADRFDSAGAMASALESGAYEAPSQRGAIWGALFVALLSAALFVGVSATWATRDPTPAAWPSPVSEIEGASPTATAPSPGVSDAAAARASPSHLDDLEDRLLNVPLEVLKEAETKVRQGDLSYVDAACQALLILAPLPPLLGVAPQEGPELSEILERWERLAEDLDPELGGRVRVACKIGRGGDLPRSEDPASLFEQKLTWRPEELGPDLILVAQDAIVRAEALGEEWFTFGYKVRTQRALLLLFDTFLQRAGRGGGRFEQLVSSGLRLSPDGRQAERVRAMAEAQRVWGQIKSPDFEAPIEVGDLERLDASVVERLARDGLTYLAGQGSVEDAVRALECAGQVSGVNYSWRGQLVERLVACWATAAAMDTSPDQLRLREALCALDCPDVLPDTRSVALVRAMALLVAGRPDDVEALLGEGEGNRWWQSRGRSPRRGERFFELREGQRRLLLAEAAMLRGDRSRVTALLQELGEYGKAFSAAERNRLGYHAGVLRIVLAASHGELSSPLPSHTLASRFLPPWRTVGHTKKILAAIVEGSWDPSQSVSPRVPAGQD